MTPSAAMTAPPPVRPASPSCELQLAERTAQLRALQVEMDNFAHRVAHDLRGPLMNIGGFAELLLELSTDKLDDKGRGYLRIIINSADQLARMLAGILTLSRLGRAELRPEPVNLAAEVAEIRRALEEANPDRRITWSVGALPVVTADLGLVRQVLTQVLGNAVKFTQPREGARIEISTESVGAETVIAIRDNGVGFDAKDSERIFGIFQQLHPASRFVGQGVGLVSVRRIMQRHGGRAWADGVADVGAVFYLAWPVSVAAG